MNSLLDAIYKLLHSRDLRTIMSGFQPLEFPANSKIKAPANLETRGMRYVTHFCTITYWVVKS